MYRFYSNFQQALYNFLYSLKLYVVLSSLIMFSMFSHASSDWKSFEDMPKDMQEFAKCIEKKDAAYCSVRHSDDGRATACITDDRATAEAIDWKNDKFHGHRNDCVFTVEVAQFRTSDGAEFFRGSIKPGEIFAVDGHIARNGRGQIASCRSPLQPVFDSEAILDYRCVKK